MPPAKDGARRALALVLALLGHDAPALLAACCELLLPESSQPLGVRVEALAAMERAAGRYLEEAGGDAEARLRLWPAQALDTLLLALGRDPSVRVRREAMRLLCSATARVGSPEERALVAAVAARCRDRDGGVREAAWAMLHQLSPQSLRVALPAADLAHLVDLALLAGAGGGPPASLRAPARQRAAIAALARDTLRRYLPGQPEADGGSDGGQDGNGAWAKQLGALRPPAVLGSGAGGAEGRALVAAWDDALAEMLSPSQLRAAEVRVQGAAAAGGGGEAVGL